MSQFLAKITGELDLKNARQELDEFINKERKISVDVELNKDTAKQLTKNIEKGLKETKVDTSALSKQLAESFNINDKSVVKTINKQLDSMMADLANTWNGKRLDLSKADGFYNGLDELAKTVTENVNVIQSKMGIYDKFFDYFKNKKIYVSDELKNAMGGDEYKQLLSNNVGKIVRDATKGISIDSIWEEMTDLFPEHFSKDVTNQVEQLTRAFEVLKMARVDIDKIIPAKELDANQFLGITDDAWAKIIESANNLKKKLEQNLNTATEKSKNTIDLDIDVNTDKIESDVRRAIKDASENIEPIDVKVDVDTEQIQTQISNVVDTKIDLPVIHNGQKLDDALDNINQKGIKGKSVFQDLGGTLTEAFKPYTMAELLADGIQEVVDVGKDAIRTIKELDDAATSLRMATGDSLSEVQQMLSDYNELGQELGSLTAEISKGSEAWLRQGMDENSTNTLLRDSMMLSKISNLSSEDATEYLTTSMKGYRVAVDDVTEIVSKLAAVDMASATEAGGLAEAMSRVAVTADSAGVSMDELLGYLSTMGEVTGRTMGSIGTSMKTIFTRMSDIKSDKLELVDEDGTTELLSDVELTLQKVGIDLRKTVTSYNSYSDVLDNLAAKWDSLNQAQQNALAKAFSGTRYAENFRIIMENYDSVLKYTNIAAQSEGMAEERFGFYLDSLEAKTNRLKASLENLATSIISTELYADVLDTSKAMVDLTEQTGILKGALTGLAGAGGLFVFQKISGWIGSAVQEFSNLNAAMEILKSGSVADDVFKSLIGLTDGLSTSQLKLILSSTSLTESQKVLLLMNTGLSQAEAKTALATMGLASAESTATTATVSLGSAMKGLIATMAANPIIAVGLAITGVVSAIQIYKNSVQEAINKTNEATKTWNSTKDSLEDYTSQYKELKEQLDSGKLKEEETIEVKKQILDIQQQIVDQYGVAAEGLDLINGKLDTQLAKVKEISVAEAEKNLRTNSKEYADAKKEMIASRTYSLGALSTKDSLLDDEYIQIRKQIEQIVEEYKSKGLRLKNDTRADAELIVFEGDVTQANEVISEFQNRIKSLNDEINGSNAAIESIITNSTSALTNNDKVLDTYQANYKSFLEQTLYAEGDYKEITKYADAVSKYNEALLSGNETEIQKAKDAYEKAKVAKDEFLAGADEDYSPLFGDIDAQVDTASEKYHEFVQKITKGEDQNRVYADQLKSMSLSSQDVRNALVTEGTQDGEDLARKLAGLYGLSEEDIAENSTNLQAFLDLLIQLGIVIDNLAGGVSSDEETFKSFFEVFTSESFEDAKESLMELAKAGELSDKTLESTEEYNNLLVQTGLKADEAKRKILDMLDQTDRTAALTQGIKNLDDAYEQFLDDGWVTAETLSALPEVFKELESYDLFESIVGNPESTKKEVQSVFDQLVTEYLYHQDAFANMLTATEDEVAIFCANLRDAGISNAEAMVEDARQQYQYYSQLLADSLQEYQDYEAGKEGVTLEFLQSVDSNTSKLVSALSEAYGIDYENWYELIQKKLALAELWENYYSSLESNRQKAATNGYDQNSGLITPGTDATAAVFDLYWGDEGKADYALSQLKKYAKSLTQDSYKSNSYSGSLAGYNGSSSLRDSQAKKDKDNSKEETKKSFDWIEVAVEQIERTIDNLDKTVSATYLKWETRNKALKQELTKVTDAISLQQKAYNKYMSLAEDVGLSDYYENLVKNGAIKYETLTNESLIEKIQQFEEFYSKAQDAQDAIIDLKDELASLARTKFDNIATEFENNASLIEHETTMLESYADILEKQGYLVEEGIYSAMIDNEQEKITLLKEKYDELSTAMNSDSIEKYSEEWFNMQQEVHGVVEEIQDVKTSIVDLENKIRDLKWDAFDRLQEKISNIASEANFLISLMEDSDLYDDKGQLTDTGEATLGLHAQNYNTYMAQADKYAEELASIEKELEYDPENQDLLERRQELLELQQESILAAQDEKQAIRDLVEEGINLELQALDDLIEKYKDAKNNAKDLYDYQKNVNEQIENLSSLQKQLSAWEGDDSEEMQAKVQQLKVELEKAQEDLDETEYEHYLEQEQKILDELYSEYELILNERLDNVDVLLSDMIDRINENSALISDTLTTEAEKVGYTLSESIQSIWANEGGATAILSKYGDNFTSQFTSIIAVLNSIADMMGLSSEETTTESSSTGSSSASTNTTQSSSSSTSPSTTKVITVGGKINAGSAKIYDYAGDTSGETQYYKNDPIYTVLDEQNGYLKVRHHKLSSGITGWFKKSDVKAYKTGGLVDETGLAWLDGTKRKPEMVLNAEDTANLMELTETLREIDENDWTKNVGLLSNSGTMFESMTSKLPPYLPSNTNQSMNNVFNMNFELHNVTNGEDVINYLIKSDRFQNVVESMTVNRLAGGSKFAKNKFYK